MRGEEVVTQRNGQAGQIQKKKNENKEYMSISKKKT
jgi:hypothetical protein